MIIPFFSSTSSSSLTLLSGSTIVAMEPKEHSSISGDRSTKKKTVASSASAKPNGKSNASSAVAMKPNGKSGVSSVILMKPNASTALSSAHDDKVMLFRDVKLGPHEVDLSQQLGLRQ
uniref:Uncharacterized protein n=1 Tax=Brassica oleracea TaxID=3712 RepID=A0A3P6F634_BRAOL|nr:unnamed protein product [Brassica oleracea]